MVLTRSLYFYLFCLPGHRLLVASKLDQSLRIAVSPHHHHHHHHDGTTVDALFIDTMMSPDEPTLDTINDRSLLCYLVNGIPKERKRYVGEVQLETSSQETPLDTLNRMVDRVENKVPGSRRVYLRQGKHSTNRSHYHPVRRVSFCCSTQRILECGHLR